MGGVMFVVLMCCALFIILTFYGMHSFVYR
jgi:hypothetical protein